MTETPGNKVLLKKMHPVASAHDCKVRCPASIVQADWSRQGGRHCVIVNIAQGLRSSHSIGRIPHDLKRRSTFVTDVRNWPPTVRWADTA